MQARAEITYRNCEPLEEVRVEVGRQIEKLEKFSGRITSCHVLVEGPKTRHRKGDPFRIELRIAMPGHRDILVSRQHGDVPEDEHPLVAMHRAFHAARRQIEDAARELRGAVKTHETADHGRVARFLAGEDCGFIETDDGRDVFFSRNAVLNDAFDQLVVGSQVRFVEHVGDKGPQASSVRLIGKHHPT